MSLGTIGIPREMSSLIVPQSWTRILGFMVGFWIVTCQQQNNSSVKSNGMAIIFVLYYRDHVYDTGL